MYLELGTVCHRAGKDLDALEAFRATADIARELGDGALLARAAIGYEDACWGPGIADQGAAELLEEAAAALVDESSELRVGLLSGLARALDYQGDHERGAIVRTNAVAMARRLDDRTGLARTLVRSYWSRGTSSLAEILEMLTEAKALGEELGNTEIVAEAMGWRVPAFVALCDLDSARREAAALRATAEQTAQPFMLHVAEHYSSAIALCDGRLDEAEAAGAALARLDPDVHRTRRGRRLRDPDVRHPPRAGAPGRARAGDQDPGRRRHARQARGAPGSSPCSSSSAWRRRRRRELARVAADGLDPFRESLWLASLTYLTDGCAALGDRGHRGHRLSRARAARRRERDDRPPGRLLRSGRSLPRHARRDARRGRARAEEHFERAMELNRRMGAPTWLAHTAYEYARLLLARGAGERDRAAGAARRGGERSPTRSACRRCSGASARSGSAAPPAGPSRRALRPRGPDPGASSPGA